MNEMVTITKKEYVALLDDSTLLNALRCAGVDNWEGFGIAMRQLEENEE